MFSFFKKKRKEEKKEMSFAEFKGFYNNDTIKDIEHIPSTIEVNIFYSPDVSNLPKINYFRVKGGCVIFCTSMGKLKSIGNLDPENEKFIKSTRLPNLESINNRKYQWKKNL